MKLGKKVIEKLRIAPQSRVRLSDYETAWAQAKELRVGNLEEAEKQTEKFLKKNIRELAKAQELLYASNSKAILIVLQGMDTAGKDGTIKHVLSGLNPQGCSVHSFKQPSAEELEHTFLWRHGKVVPERGRIAIFNRSYYEDVLVVRVHPEWLAKERESVKGARDLWESRFDDINSFERHLSRNGTVILKFFLHISKKEQRRRLLSRLSEPDKLWKFSPSDLSERGFWKQYQRAYEQAIESTSTPWAPWYIIPSDYKWAARALVADVITHTIDSLKLRPPTIDEATRKLAQKAKSRLERE